MPLLPPPLHGNVTADTVKLPDTIGVTIDPSLGSEIVGIGTGATYNQWGAPYVQLGAIKDEFGWVHLTGVLRIPVAVTLYGGVQLGTLPVGMRPVVTKYLTTHGSTGTGSDIQPVIIQVAASGIVSIWAHQFFMNNTVEKYLTLDNLKFPASDSVTAWASGIGIGGNVFRKNMSNQYIGFHGDTLLVPFDFETIFYSENGCTVYRLPNGQVFMDGKLTAPVDWTTSTVLMQLPPQFRHPDPVRIMYFPVAYITGPDWGQCILGVSGDGTVRVIYGIPASGPASTDFYVQGLTWKADRPIGALPYGDQPANEPLDQSLFMPDSVGWTASAKANGWVPYASASYYDEAHRADEWNYLGLRGLIKNGTNAVALTGMPVIGNGSRVLTIASSTAGAPGSWRRVDLNIVAGTTQLVSQMFTTNGLDNTSGWRALDGIYVPRLI